VSGAASLASTRTGWELHGVRVSLRSGSEEVNSYLRAHLGPDAGEEPAEPDLKINLEWHWDSPPAAPEETGGPAQRVGRHLVERGGRLTWGRVPGFEGLTLEAGRRGKAMEITASCRYVPRDSLARLRYMQPSRRARKTHRTFFKLLYYAIYFPLIWHLEQTRGWELLHASAIERDGRALILAGHGGAGKSTLALSLMADPAMRFISDNLILHDGRKIYALPEPVRLDGSSLKAIRAAGFEPSACNLPRTAHPKPTFRVDPARVAHEGEAGAVALLRFTDEPSLRILSGTEAAAHLAAARDLVKEVEAHRAVAAFLSMAAAGSAKEKPAETATLGRLTAGVKGYMVGIGRGESVEQTRVRLGEVFP
jgi:hypothetical protein